MTQRSSSQGSSPAQSLTSYFSAGSFFPQRYTPGPLGYEPGLHIVHGARGSAKSTNMLALGAYLAKQHKVNVSYYSIMEPRGKLFSSAMAVNTGAAANKSSVTSLPANSVISATYEAWLIARLGEAKAAQNASGSKLPSVVILDSITYLLKGLKMTKDALEVDRGATYPGGLSYADILGALHHSQLAAASGVVMFGIINSELYPVVDKLEGATEGVVESSALGVLIRRSRGTARVNETVGLPGEFLQAALTTLYPGAGDGATRSSGSANMVRW